MKRLISPVHSLIFASLLCLFYSFPVVAQQRSGETDHPLCANDVLYNRYMQDSGNRERWKKDNLKTKYYMENVLTGLDKKYNPQPLYATAPCMPSPYVIPVVFYILENATSLPAGTVSYSQVKSALAALNAYFLPHGIQFCTPTTYPDHTAIHYSAGEPGVFRISSPLTNLHYITNYPLFAGSETPALNAMVPPGNTSALNADNYLRIYIVNDIDGTGGTSGVVGLSSIPDMHLNWDFIIMNYRFFGNSHNTSITDFCSSCTTVPIANCDQGKILTHEVGHYLNLYHIFQNGCSTVYGDPSLDGDAVPDTEPVNLDGSNLAANNYYSCTSIPSNYCSGTPGPNDDGNYMQWVSEPCLTHFSPQQSSRMLATLNLSRRNLCSPENLYNVKVSCAPAINYAAFNVNSRNICFGSALTCTAGTYPAGSTFSFDFGDGSPIVTSGGFASHTYGAMGIYTLRFKAFNASGVVIACYDMDIFVTTCSAMDCSKSRWYFASKAGLDFSTGSPVAEFSAYTHNTIVTDEAAVTVSDSACNLLFYTDGVKVWDKNHLAINPVPLYGHVSTAQAIAVRNPGNPHQYYILHSPGNTDIPHDRFYYSVVDISGTSASMLPANCNLAIPLPAGVTHNLEGITAIPDCAGMGYWIFTTSNDVGGDIIVHHLTAAGFSAPVTYPVGVAVAPSAGLIKASPNGKRLAINNVGCTGCLRSVLVLNFNGATGVLSGPLLLPQATTDDGYGISFSPNSRYLYECEGQSAPIPVYQYDLMAPDVAASKYLVCSGSYGMALGPDDKIYLTQADMLIWNKLAVINFPNVGGAGCGFMANAVSLTGFTGYPIYAYVSLPNMVDAKESPASAHDFTWAASACLNYHFLFANDCATGYSWNFGNPASGTANTSALQNPLHSFTDTGVYTVSLIASFGGALDTIVHTIRVGISNLTLSGPDSIYKSACMVNAPINYSVVSNPIIGVTYKWTIVNTDAVTTTFAGLSTANVLWAGPGTGTVKVKASDVAGCADSLTMPVHVFTGTPLAITSVPDVLISLGSSTTLTAMGAATYTWSPTYGLSCTGCPSPVANPTVTTTYTVSGTDGYGCQDSVTITVHVAPVGVGSLSMGDDALAIYPNPAANDLILQRMQGGGERSYIMTIYDVDGRQVMNEALDFVTASIHVPLQLADGVYSVVLVNKDGMKQIRKLVVVN